MADKFVNQEGARIIADEIKKKYEKPEDGIPEKDIKDGVIPRPTYFKLNGTAMTDIGGVGTRYTIAISNLTPSTPTPVMGDTVVFYTDSFTYIGSVVQTQASAIVVEVKVSMLGKGGGGVEYYDTVIGSQEDFEAWYTQLDDGAYEGHSVLFLNGTYTRSDGKGLHLPNTLKQLHGLGTVKIDITNFVYTININKAGIWYTTTPTAKEYSIENISLNCTGSGKGYGNVYGFHSCTNLTNCTGSGKGSDYGYGFYSCTNLTNCTGSGDIGYGFHSCTNLTNCTGSGSGATGFGSGYGFYSCTNLTNCTGSGKGSGNAYGFYSCTNLTNCTGSGKGSGYVSGDIGASGYGFYSCTNLTNCTGSGKGYDYGYGFYSCKICSNCRQDPDESSQTATWGNGNTNVDPNTCPEYVGG